MSTDTAAGGEARVLNVSRQHGFSMIQLVVVMVIIAILAAVAIPTFTAGTTEQRVSAAAGRIVADLELARRRAYTSSESCTVHFDVNADEYRIEEMADPHDPDREYVVGIGDEPYIASLSSVDFDGASTVVFDLHGSPGITGTIVVSVGDRQRVIRLDAESGKATVEE